MGKYTQRKVARQNEKKAVLVDYKGGECCICGYNKCNGALDFHHVGKKTMKVSHQIGKLSAGAFVNGRVNSILREIDQCQILCSNCHRMIHRKKKWLTIEELKSIYNEKGSG